MNKRGRKIKKPDLNEFKRIINVVKTVLGISYETNKLTSVKKCEDALIEIIHTYGRMCEEVVNAPAFIDQPMNKEVEKSKTLLDKIKNMFGDLVER